MVGSLEQYPNETAAQKAVAALRADINAENPRTSLTQISVQTLIEHYREKELGPNCSKTRKTQVTYEGYFNNWILPRWGGYRITDVKAVAVEQWLRSLQYANGSKAKARNIMSAVFNHAVRWEWRSCPAPAARRSGSPRRSRPPARRRSCPRRSHRGGCRDRRRGRAARYGAGRGAPRCDPLMLRGLQR